MFVYRNRFDRILECHMVIQHGRIPILSETFNDRGQMDLIDMQATPDSEYKWILHYQDNLTKFSYLRALRNKSKLLLY